MAKTAPTVEAGGQMNYREFCLPWSVAHRLDFMALVPPHLRRRTTSEPGDGSERPRQQPFYRLQGARRAKECSPRRKPWGFRVWRAAPERGERNGAQSSLAPFRGCPGCPAHPRLTPWATFLRSYGAISVSDALGFSSAPQFTIRVRTCFDPSTCRHESRTQDGLPTALFRVN
jgi:hypothetical protein